MHSDETRRKQSKSATVAHKEGRHSGGWKKVRADHLCSEEHAKKNCGCSGWHHTEESLARIGVAVAEHFQHGERTSLELALALLLDEAGIDYREQVCFGRYVVDFWVSDLQTVFEADGLFWHADLVREARRDQYLLSHGAISVIHWNEDDLAPWISMIQQEV